LFFFTSSLVPYATLAYSNFLRSGLSHYLDSDHSLADENTPIHISAADPSLIVTVSRARNLTQATSYFLRKHFGIGASGANKDIVSVISTGHYLLPVAFYGVIGAGGVFSAASSASTGSELSKQIQGAGSKCLICVEDTKDVAIRAAEEAGWGTNGGGRVLVMSEGAEWSIRAVEANGLGPNLIDEKQKLPWKKITNPEELENSLVTLIYSSGTTGLPKGMSPVSLTSLERMRILKCTTRC
jgi:4-coumarate--CoA ligase